MVSRRDVILCVAQLSAAFSVNPATILLVPSVPTETDFVVVGAGVAGLRAAIELAPAGRVLVVVKAEHTESNTQYAQGGVAVSLSDEDEVELHLQDTLNAGDGIVDPEAARVLVEEGPVRIEELIQWGTEFDRAGTKLAFTREGAHSRNRVLHAHGDSTGREMARALWEKSRMLPSVSVCEFAYTTDLIVEDGRVTGITLLSSNGELHHVHASAVVLATGGLGQVYANTTNPAVATGDGVAMAFRAGAEISDMEFVQFHPTALYLKGAPRFLLSEALRGEGAILRNGELMRFMPKYHSMGELAPRDVVARAIAHELEVSHVKEPMVYLDMTHLTSKHLDKRFPRIYSTCMQYNIDITSELVPIRPAAHYAMGGVRTDLDGATSINGLYAAGEVACTGVHGANRLASNSLLEGLVFGARAGAAIRANIKISKHARARAVAHTDTTNQPGIEEHIKKMQDLMWRDVGLSRSGGGLKRAIRTLEDIRPEIEHAGPRRCWEAKNIHTTGMLIARSALARLESRGAHYRTDYPAHDDARFKKHSVVTGEKITFE
jgi:L-aspartate oxidase